MFLKLLIKEGIRMKKRLFAIGFVMSLIMFIGIGLFFAEEVSAQNSVSIQTENDIMKILGDIYVAENEVVNGNVISILGDIEVEGRVKGDVVSILGDIKLNNIVEGDLVSVLGQVNRGPDAQVLGETTQVRVGDINISGLSRIIPRNVRRVWFNISGGMFSIFRLITLFGLVLLVFALMPGKQKNMAEAVKQSLVRKLLIGLLTFLCFPVILFLFMISILGIPAVPFIIMGFFVISFLGYVSVAYLTGETIAGISDQGINIYLTLFLGVLVLWILNSIPFLGFLFRLLILFISLGVIIDTKFGTNQPWFKTKTN